MSWATPARTPRGGYPTVTAAAGDVVDSGWDVTAGAVTEASTAVAARVAHQTGGGRGDSAPGRLGYRVPDDVAERDTGPVWER